MIKTKTKRLRITKGEVLLYTTATLCLCLTIVLKTFGSATISQLSMITEQTRYKINVQETKNESLTMKVNELTAFDKIKDVVSDMGLAYNNDKIIIIND
ncbi:MAG: hypothetical protein ACK5HP_00865 [Bacilli bacterium]